MYIWRTRTNKETSILFTFAFFFYSSVDLIEYHTIERTVSWFIGTTDKCNSIRCYYQAIWIHFRHAFIKTIFRKKTHNNDSHPKIQFDFGTMLRNQEELKLLRALSLSLIFGWRWTLAQNHFWFCLMFLLRGDKKVIWT